MELIRVQLMKWFDRVVIRTFRGFFRRTGTGAPTAINRLHHLAAQDAAEFMMQHMSTALIYYHRFEILDYAVKLLPPEGLLLEFGVYKAQSLEYVAKRVRPRRIFGFDSFEGLQESWPGQPSPARAMSRAGRLPRVSSNVSLVAGWFDQTLKPWMQNNPGNLALLHIDSDTYEACKFLLATLHDRIDENTVIVFDEHHGYPGWRHGEFKAFNEYLAAHNRLCTYLAFSEAGAIAKIHR